MFVKLGNIANAASTLSATNTQTTGNPKAIWIEFCLVVRCRNIGLRRRLIGGKNAKLTITELTHLICNIRKIINTDRLQVRAEDFFYRVSQPFSTSTPCAKARLLIKRMLCQTIRLGDYFFWPNAVCCNALARLTDHAIFARCDEPDLTVP